MEDHGIGCAWKKRITSLHQLSALSPASCSTLHDYQPRRLEETLFHAIAAGAFPSTLTDSSTIGTVSSFLSRRFS
jgi:hypothetical protein